MEEEQERMEEDELESRTEQIKEMGNITIPNAKHIIHCLNPRLR